MKSKQSVIIFLKTIHHPSDHLGMYPFKRMVY